MLTFDVSIIKKMIKKGNSYYLYFYPEIKGFFDKSNLKLIIDEMIKYDHKVFINFKEKREKGENDSPLCSIIRRDSVDEFIVYINERNIPLSQKINVSIFETNKLLLKRETTLIEYAAFYGSIRIIKYLKLNDVKLTSSLWIYSIHSNDPELIHFLEENNVEPDNLFSFKEAVKCHHNEIANYIYENYLHEEDKIPQECPCKFRDFAFFNIYNRENFKPKTIFDKDINSYLFHYYNYQFLPINFDSQILLFYACYFDHLIFVKYLVNTHKWDINNIMILASFFI